MIVVVTGGSGFLGQSVLPRLTAHSHEVRALARTQIAARTVQATGATPVFGDLDDQPSLVEAFTGADTLVNLASLGFGHATAIVEAAEKAGVCRTVFISTTAIFTTLPATSKQVRIDAEDRIRNSALAWTIVRPTMIYGLPGDRNMERLLRFLCRTPVFPLPDGGSRLQQPVHVEDLADAVVATTERPATAFHTYDLAGPTPLTFRHLVLDAATAVGRRPLLISVPLRPAIQALSLYERISRRPGLKTEQLERLAEDKSFDITSAREDLDFEPRPFAAAIRAEAGLLER